MNPPLHDEQPLPRASWTPCQRACYQTLQWPVADTVTGHLHGAARRAAGPVLPPACLPQLPQPAHRLLALCGEEGLCRLVHLHMKRLRHTSLLAHTGNCFDCVAQRMADFVVEACGGPLYYSQHHTRLLAGAGLPLLLDAEGREIWLVQLWHAFEDADFPAPLRADYWSWAEPLSVHLLAPQARHRGLTRYPYDTVRSWFPAATQGGTQSESQRRWFP